MMSDVAMDLSLLPFPEGIVGCVGLVNNKGGSFKYVRHFEFYFTGLDARVCKLCFSVCSFGGCSQSQFDA